MPRRERRSCHCRVAVASTGPLIWTCSSGFNRLCNERGLAKKDREQREYLGREVFQAFDDGTPTKLTYYEGRLSDGERSATAASDHSRG